jgi:DNA mismatch repair protein MutS2
MRGDRYCVPVRSDNRNAVPGILHERSGSGASFFIEPMNAVELNNDLADLLIQEREEIARITRYVAQLVFESHEDISLAVELAGEFDALQACAQFFEMVDASFPTFSEKRELSIREGRHPLLDERLAAARAEAFGERPGSANIVPLTIALNEETPALVISGPNAGGKTVALKTAGLLVAMGMSGLPVPAAEGSVLPCIDTIHVLIGDDQSVLEHLSTFSGYLTRLKRVLENATPQSLVLLDELGSGTDPEEGAALAAAVIEHLLGVGSLLIATTHLSALKSFAVNDGRIVNASMEFNPESGHPTYRMISGIPGRSRAIEVARMIGLPASIIANARERLGERYGETDQLLSELHRKMTDVIAQQDEAAKMRRETEREGARLREALEKTEAERTKIGAKYREELERLRDDVTRQLSAELKALRDADRTSRATVNPNTLVATITKSIDRAVEFLPVEQREVRVGEKAEHRKFKVTGKVASIDGTKAVLDVNGRRMTVETSDLVPVTVAAPPPKLGPL